MANKIEIKEEARQDILQAALWYKNKSDDLDTRFIEQLERIIKSIRNNPKTFKKIYKSFRQAALKKFPYVLLYEHYDSTIIIYSVFHTSRHPRKKINILRK